MTPEPPGYVRVALPRGPDTLFTYRLPAALGSAEPGSRVMVPFAGRILTGVVVETLPAPDIEEERLKDVRDVLDPEPSLPPVLMKLATFIAEYYLCPIGDVLRTVHPGAAHVTWLAALTPAGHLALGGAIRGPKQRAVLEALAATDELALEALRKRTKASELAPTLRDLQARGWLVLRSRMTRAPRAKTVLAYAATGAPAARTTALQASVLSALAESEEPLTIREIAALTGRPPGPTGGVVRALVARGRVREESRHVVRSPAVLAGSRGRPVQLTPEQARAVDQLKEALDGGRFEAMLLEGVTGSGKTEVYFHAIAHAIAAGRQCIYLVPEISLTPLLMRQVRARFGARTAILHSGLSTGERHDERARILAGEVDLVLGARSAIFAPLPRLGLLVVDEEHDSSYKQDSQPRYHARDVGVVRASLEKAVVVLGSATPSLESYTNALGGRYHLRRLPHRVGGSSLSRVEIVDMREEWKATRQVTPISRRLREALDATLAHGKQAMLLLNRRGWADFLLCRECGEAERCEHCSVSLTVHLKLGRLLCHYCGAAKDLPESCGKCGGTFLQQVGQGTEQLETLLRKTLPDVPLVRLDADVARRKGAVAEILSGFEAGKWKVLLGTQLIAKAHDFPGVTLVGVLQADRQLWLPDFRASERTFQLLTQVAGRAGRRADAGLVVVQTYTPDHPAMTLVERQDYPAFYESEAPARRALGYPPFAHLVGLLVSGEDQGEASAHAGRLGEKLREHAKGVGARVLGPAPAPLARLKDRWRFQVLVKSRDRTDSHEAVRLAVAACEPPAGITVEVDVDPQSLL